MQKWLYSHLTNQALSQDQLEETKNISILIKETIHQENLKIINTYAPNSRASNFIKQILLDIKREIDPIQ